MSTFVMGAIDPSIISEAIAERQANSQTGAYNIFLGQVRSDVIDSKKVKAIKYSSHTSMAEKVFARIKSEAIQKYELQNVTIAHSLGEVMSGEICLFVMVCSGHRDVAYTASRYVVEEIKAQVPVFGQELFADDSYVWKVNN